MRTWHLDLRIKMVHELKKDSSVKNVWTMDGRIFCKQVINGKEEIKGYR